MKNIARFFVPVAFAGTLAVLLSAAPSPDAESTSGYRVLYTQRELLDRTHIMQWWQRVNDLFHRSATMKLGTGHSVRVDVTFQGYEYTRALKAMQGFDGRLSPDEVVASFRKSFRADALVFNVSAYMEDEGAPKVALVEKVWMTIDGVPYPARSLRAARRDATGRSVVLDAEFDKPASAPQDPQVALEFASGGSGPARGKVLFPVSLLVVPPAARTQGGPARRAKDSSEPPAPLAPIAEQAVPAGPPAYTRNELHDTEYVHRWWKKVSESHRAHYGEMDWVGNAVILDAVFESREYLRALCASEGYDKRLTDPEIEARFRKREKPGELSFLVRFTSTIWPARALDLGDLAAETRLRLDGGEAVAPRRVEAAKGTLLQKELEVRFVFDLPKTPPAKQAVLELKGLPTHHEIVRLAFPRELFEPAQ